jgi:hypothetical protein
MYYQQTATDPRERSADEEQQNISTDNLFSDNELDEQEESEDLAVDAEDSDDM